MKILVIEDDKTIAAYIAKGLREAGYTVDVAHDGDEGSDLAQIGPYDAAVVDIMLPGTDGLTIIEEMRAEKIATPVLILSAKRSVDDRVKGLRAGGDDYMVKPFSFSELEARIEALIRRAAPADSADSTDSSILRVADLELDSWKHEVRRAGQTITLQPREFRFLEFLARNAGRVLTKTSILEHVYEYNFDPQTNVVDVLVHRLRSKIDKDFEPKLIHTIRGAGYVLKAE
ncbi:MAG: response regulator transcription factor [Verrucomicrobiota bacterium]